MVDHPSRACPHFLAKFSEFVDDVLPPERRAQFEAHLDCCEGCLHHLAAYRKGVDALRSVPLEEADPAEFWDRLQSRIWIDRIESPPPPIARRAMVYGALAAALAALALVWLGGRLDGAWDSLTGRTTPPIVVVAAGPGVESPPATASEPSPAWRSGASVTRAPAGRSLQPRSSPMPIRLASAAPAGRAVETPEFDHAAEAVLEREVRALRERLELDSRIGESILDGRSAQVLPSEAIPVSSFLPITYQRP